MNLTIQRIKVNSNFLFFNRKTFISLFCIALSLTLFSCSASKVIKKDTISVYNVKGYLSSRKDHASFDMEIKGDLVQNQYSIKGYDTLLKKERFLLLYHSGQWILKDQEKPDKFYIINPNQNFAEILPPPSIFDYIAFFRGEIPLLKNAKIEKKPKEWILIKGDFKQTITFEKEGFIKEMSFYKNEQRVYKIIYKDYISTQNLKMVFPKTLNIFDYQKKRKIVWWMSQINTKEKK